MAKAAKKKKSPEPRVTDNVAAAVDRLDESTTRGARDVDIIRAELNRLTLALADMEVEAEAAAESAERILREATERYDRDTRAMDTEHRTAVAKLERDADEVAAKLGAKVTYFEDKMRKVQATLS